MSKIGQSVIELQEKGLLDNPDYKDFADERQAEAIEQMELDSSPENESHKQEQEHEHQRPKSI